MFYNNEQYQLDIDLYAKDSLYDNFNGKSILITGAGGLIGTVLVDILMKKNIKYNGSINVIALDKNENTKSERFFEYLNNENFVFLAQNVCNELLLKQAPDYIIHAASNTSPLDYAEMPIETMTANFIGTYELLKYSAINNVKRFLFCSSVEIYGQNNGDTDYFNEDYCGYINSNLTRSAYPESKRASESLCNSFMQQKNVDFVIARIGRIFGPTVIMNDAKAPTQFILNALNKENIVLKSEGTQEYSYGYVNDAAHALLFLLLEGKSGEAYNVVNEKGQRQLKEFARSISKLASKEVVFELSTSLDNRGYSKVTKALMNTQKLIDIGYSSKITIEDGLQKTYQILSEGCYI